MAVASIESITQIATTIMATSLCFELIILLCQNLFLCQELFKSMGRNLEKLQRQQALESKDKEIEELRKGPNKKNENLLKKEIKSLKLELEKKDKSHTSELEDRDMLAYKKQFKLAADQLKIDLEIELKELKSEIANLSKVKESLEKETPVVKRKKKTVTAKKKKTTTKAK